MVNFSLILFAESEAVYTDGGVLAEFSWLLVVLPFFAALLITFFGKYGWLVTCQSNKFAQSWRRNNMKKFCVKKLQRQNLLYIKIQNYAP